MGALIGLRRGNLYTQIVAINRLDQALRDVEAANRRAQADILNAIRVLLDTARALTEQEIDALGSDADIQPP